MDEGRRIPPFADDALSVLTEAAGGTGEELPKDEAKAVIADAEGFDEADAEAALDVLQSRECVYYVGEYVRITPTED